MLELGEFSEWIKIVLGYEFEAFIATDKIVFKDKTELNALAEACLAHKFDFMPIFASLDRILKKQHMDILREFTDATQQVMYSFILDHSTKLEISANEFPEWAVNFQSLLDLYAAKLFDAYCDNAAREYKNFALLKNDVRRRSIFGNYLATNFHGWLLPSLMHCDVTVIALTVYMKHYYGTPVWPILLRLHNLIKFE